jgi:hypothetical protein
VAIEFAKGFATYNILPGLNVRLKSGLTIVDLSGKPITSKLDLEDRKTSSPRSGASAGIRNPCASSPPKNGAGGTGA